jgi:hypothetical protein
VCAPRVVINDQERRPTTADRASATYVCIASACLLVYRIPRIYQHIDHATGLTRDEPRTPDSNQMARHIDRRPTDRQAGSKKTRCPERQRRRTQYRHAAPGDATNLGLGPGRPPTDGRLVNATDGRKSNGRTTNGCPDKGWQPSASSGWLTAKRKGKDTERQHH